MPKLSSVKPYSHDPLLTETPLTHSVIYYPYGFPVRISSNSEITLKAAEVSWATYRQKYKTSPIDVRCLISESSSPAQTLAPTFRSQGNLLSIVADAENFACLDLEKSFSFGWMTKATVESTEYFRQCFLDVMIYPLLEIRHLVTLHAACLMFDGKGVLLAGASGAGKSSLAYACASRGWTYVSDDASAFVRTSIRPMVIGHPQKFRFREPVGELFPEFQGLKSTTRTYGKPTIEVKTASLEGINVADESPIDYIVFLNREDYVSGPPLLLRVSPEDAWERFRPSVWAIQLPAFTERLAALKRLVRLPIYELRYTDLNAAIDTLQQLVSKNHNPSNSKLSILVAQSV
jgi:hypothetical protein